MWSQVSLNEGYAGDGSWAQFETCEGSSAVSHEYGRAETLAEQSVHGFADYAYTVKLGTVNVRTATNFFITGTFGSNCLATDLSEPPEVFFSQDNGTTSGLEAYRFTGKPYGYATCLCLYYLR